MKAKAVQILLVALLSSAVAGELPRSLVSRMLDAHEHFKAPKKEMRLETNAVPVVWPFDIARIEGLLEKALARSEDGRYHLAREDAAAPGDSKAKSMRALAYVNKVIADWAVLQLDAKFPRCDAKTVTALAGYRVDMDPAFWQSFAILTKKGLFGGGAASVKGWISAWKVADQMYLVVTSELAAEGCPRDYQFVRWDGTKDWPIVGFEEFPDAQRAGAAMQVTENSAAANNLAALVHAREANRRLYMPQYVEQLLRRAATGGSEAAFHNLGVLMEEQGDLEQAKAYYSRERSAAD